MSAANPNPMEKSMVSVLVVANAGGGHRCRVVLFLLQHAPSAASEASPPPNDDNAVEIANLDKSIAMHHRNEKRLYKIAERVIGLCNNQHQYFEDVNSKMDNLLQEMEPTHHTAMATPPLHLQQPPPKPSIFASDSDSQHSFTYLFEFPESSRLMSLIFVAKSEFSRILAHPTTRNATKTSPTPRPTAQTVWERVQSPCGPS
jgi:hypothetical protein